MKRLKVEWFKVLRQASRKEVKYLRRRISYRYPTAAIVLVGNTRRARGILQRVELGESTIPS